MSFFEWVFAKSEVHKASKYGFSNFIVSACGFLNFKMYTFWINF